MIDLDVLKRFKRWDLRLWLGLLASIAFVLPSSSYAIQGAASLAGSTTPVDSSALIYAAIGLLGAIVTLLGSVVMAVRSVIKHRSPEVRGSDMLSRVVKMLEEQEHQRERDAEALRRDFERMEERLEQRIERIRLVVK